MALTTLFKRVARLGGDRKIITTTTKLGTNAKNILGKLTGKTQVVNKVAASTSKTAVKSTVTDASKARKILNPQVINKASSGIKSSAQSATSRIIKGAGISGLVALPLAGGGYGIAKLGQSIGEVRQGFKGASPEDLASSRLDIIDKIIEAGGNPADYGFTEQNMPDRKDGADSPQFIFGGDQPQQAQAPATIGDQISKVVLVGGAVAGGLLLLQTLTKKKLKR